MTDYDFIVVGAGPAGSALASRLAKNSPSTKVLLLEAGGKNDDKNNRFLYDRYSTFVTAGGYNYNYMTVPQKHLNDNQLFYARGRGLGGSSAINFCCYTIGPQDDHDEWARSVGDDTFSWANAKRRFAELETFHNPTNPEVNKYSNIASWHGKTGPLSVEFPQKHEISIAPSMEALKQAGIELSPDINSGNPLGFGVSPSTAKNGLRSTAAAAFLDAAPSNLTIVTDAQVRKILVDGKRALGVETVDGRKYLASKETILSAGSLDSPKLLLLSGIGPKEELDPHGIELEHSLPGVGRNLTDHFHFIFAVEQQPNLDERSPLFSNAEKLAEARAQFALDGTGPFNYMNHSLPMGFLKDEAVFTTPEFQALPPHVQAHLRKPTVPTWELIAELPVSHFLPGTDPSKTFFGLGAILLNTQSRGTVTLASANPADPPVCDPNAFSHPYDRASIVSSARKLMDIFNSPTIAKNTIAPVVYPESDSDEDIWELLKKNISTTWHMIGTCRMGKDGDDTAVVDSKFKVRGIEGLRVVDLSVLPFVPNCHPVSWAYLTGWTGAEVLAKEYGLA